VDLVAIVERPDGSYRTSELPSEPRDAHYRVWECDPLPFEDLAELEELESLGYLGEASERETEGGS
jgi:hypothetical protein